METRKSVLVDLVQLKGDISDLEDKLADFSWDSEETLYVVQKEDILGVFARYLSGEIDAELMGDWASALECREDLDYATDGIRAVVDELANPALYHNLSPELVERFREGLE